MRESPPMIELRMMLLSLLELGPCRRAGASCNTLPLFLEDLSEPQSGRTVNFEIEEINRRRQRLQEGQCVKVKQKGSPRLHSCTIH